VSPTRAARHAREGEGGSKALWRKLSLHMPQRKDAAYQKKGSAVRSIRHLQFKVHFLASCDELVYYEANNKRQGDDQVKLGYLLIPGMGYTTNTETSPG
jgi:hypothetical protein